MCHGTYRKSCKNENFATIENPQLEEKKIQPSNFPPTSQRIPAKFELHIFADASNYAYATAAYSTVVYSDGTINSDLTFSKLRIRPMPTAVPKTQLCRKAEKSAKIDTSNKENLNELLKSFISQTGTFELGKSPSDSTEEKSTVALIASRAAHSLRAQPKPNHINIYIRSDSTIVVFWIKNLRLLKKFAEVRVREKKSSNKNLIIVSNYVSTKKSTTKKTQIESPKNKPPSTSCRGSKATIITLIFIVYFFGVGRVAAAEACNQLQYIQINAEDFQKIDTNSIVKTNGKHLNLRSNQHGIRIRQGYMPVGIRPHRD